MVFAAVKQIGNRVIVKFQDSPSGEQDVKKYLIEMKAIYDKKEKFLILYDCLKVGWLEWKYIKMQADFMHQQADETKDLMVRAAIVVDSAVTRGVLKTLFAIRKPACPLQVFNKKDKAKQYLHAAKLVNIE